MNYFQLSLVLMLKKIEIYKVFMYIYNNNE